LTGERAGRILLIVVQELHWGVQMDFAILRVLVADMKGFAGIALIALEKPFFYLTPVLSPVGEGEGIRNGIPGYESITNFKLRITNPVSLYL
jgi:hypothetical protein